MSSKKIKFQELEVKKLSKDFDVSSFCYGHKPVDEFIHKEAIPFQEDSLVITYLWFYEKKIVGIVTLSMADVKKEKMGAEDRLSIGRENYPALLIGQLGVIKDLQNHGIGTTILNWCLGKAIELSEDVGCRFLVLNSEDFTINWYKKFGFKLIPKQKRQRKLMFFDIVG